ncbi:beta-galactosidase [Vampirovibrio chlorellavorus]|uniref:beta-galactosidase n=1 Tax=Vampirovibrio chlorellavorus TaxID=758823 RepID=UPI0026F0CF5E|nr:beta-galactosidase [Vampirovibrio chlorellavorus]
MGLQIRYDKYSLIIDGQRTFIRSGAMHYFRLPSQALWQDRLFKLKAAGYNAVDLYFCWNYHSPAQGVYDFTGIRDVQELLKITQELGLFVIARPGPYINAEYSGGGFPGWLLAKRHLPLRNRREGAFEWSEEYMAYVTEWWRQIIPFINAAPNVILMQIENEYATLEVEPDYMRALYDLSRQLGVTVPLFHNDLYVAGLYEDIVDIYAFDNYSVTQFETDWREMPEVFQVLDHVEDNLRPFCQNRPLMAAELQAGWFGTWRGYKYQEITETLGREHIALSTKSLLGQGLTIFNHYKAIGGTNWDYTGSIETYTSYDFGAPISETGLNTERLFESKALNYFLESFDLSATEREVDFPLPLSHRECFYACRSVVGDTQARWLFLRNLTYEPATLTVAEAYPVTVNAFEAQILPHQVPLRCGYRLAFSTVEALHQNESLLILKGDRAATVTLSQNGHSQPLTVEGDSLPNGVEILSQEPEAVTLYCREMRDQEACQVQIGALTLIFLSKDLVDTFWVEPEGHLVFGPEARLPDRQYGLLLGKTRFWSTDPTARALQAHVLEAAPPLPVPALRDWHIFNEAPELTEFETLKPGFVPVSPHGLDFDSNGIYEGSAWYWVPLGRQRPETLTLDARHIWAVYFNGQRIGHGHQLVVIHGMAHAEPVEIPVPESLWRPNQDNELLIFVNGLGHPKGFHDDAQLPQGLLSLSVDGVSQQPFCHIRQETFSRSASSSTENALATLEGFEVSPIVLMQTHFMLPDDQGCETAWGLKLQDVDFERINIYLNNVLIGRYWRDCRRQEVFYLPTGVLKQGADEQNLLALVLINFDPPIDKTRLSLQPHQVALYPYATLQKALHRAD